jgi:hypothetical protein
MVMLNRGQRSGVKKPFRLEEIWRIKTRLEVENSLMQLALLNLAIDSKLRASDLPPLRVCDGSSQDRIFNRVKHIQQKDDIDVQFENNDKNSTKSDEIDFDCIVKHKRFFFQANDKSNNQLATRTIDISSESGHQIWD